MFQHNPDEFLRRFITVDETWIYYFTLETKEQSKQWTSLDEPAAKKTKTIKSAGKVMATVFWDARGIIHIDYLLSKQTINGDYAALDYFNNILKKKHSHLAKKKVLFHQNNARVHTCPASMAKFNKFRYELLPHPVYSPDLAFYNYFLYPNLKKWFRGKRFITRGLIAKKEIYFEGLDKSYYSNGLKNRRITSNKSNLSELSIVNISMYVCFIYLGLVSLMVNTTKVQLVSHLFPI